MELNDFWHISTVNTWSPRENNNIYGKRRDIEVFFKMAPKHVIITVEVGIDIGDYPLQCNQGFFKHEKIFRKDDAVVG